MTNPAGRRSILMAASIGHEVCTFNRSEPRPLGVRVNQEPGPHGARSQFYPMQGSNAGRRGGVPVAEVAAAERGDGSLPIQPHGGITLTCCNLISSIKMKYG
jgi:hypothetical protein